MLNSSKIQILKEKIYASLDPLIDSDYCLLDFPNYENIGDNLIWVGELEYLSRFKYNCNYSCCLQHFDKNKIKTNDLILMQGGGNFGDLYRKIQLFRLEVIQNFPDNKIVIFPQTVHYNDLNILKKDAEILNRHTNLTICVRDYKSMEIIKNYFLSAKVLLIPDMAFCLDFEKHINEPIESNNNKLLFKRVDIELATNDYLLKIQDRNKLEIHDWPTYERNILQRLFYKLESKIAKEVFKIPFLRIFIDPKTGFKNTNILNKYFQQGIDFVNVYDEIYTTRLHGLILAILLNKKVYLNFLEHHCDVGVLGSLAVEIDEKGNEFGLIAVKTGDINIKKDLSGIIHPSVMIRKEVITENYMYLETYPYSEDFELWIRLSKITKFENLDEVLIKKRRHDEQLTQIEIKIRIRETIKLRLIYFFQTKYFPDIKVIIKLLILYILPYPL